VDRHLQLAALRIRRGKTRTLAGTIMTVRAKVGAVLVAVGLFMLPVFYWAGRMVVYAGIAIAAVGFVLLLWSGSKSAAAAGLGTGGFDDHGPIDPPDAS